MRTRGKTLAFGPLIAVVLSTSAAGADGSKVQFPEGFEKGVRYQTLDRHDVKQYRELYTSKEVVAAVKKGQPIPSGTVLTLVQYKAKVDDKGVPLKDGKGHFVKGDLIGYTVMEKRSGWGAEYPDDVRNGEWEYQAFTPDKQVNAKADLKTCFRCHKPHEKQDFVISLAKLNGSFPKGTGKARAMAKPDPGTVAIADFLFGPETVVVNAGQKVTWTNTDDSPHQILVQSKDLRSDVMLRGETQSLAFDQPGTYEYSCGLHPSMKGKIEVK
jgi:plastocyanin